MNSVLTDSMFFGAVISVLGYLIGIYCRKKISVVNPLLIAIVLTIVVIKVLDIDYETYNSGAKYISYLLTPATVCLAIPLYRQINVLKSHAKEVFIGILAGVIASMGSILLMAYLFSLTHEQYVTLLPKSITTAIGMGVSEELGGIQTITIAVIIITGVFGNIIAEGVLKIFRIKEPVAKGLAIGTASHAIGTAKALEIGETEGAMSSLAVAVAGLMTVATASFFASLL
ncbi:MAG: LrgB family protein [Clostridia bacterium]|nr:LrgB family protein [Clostridia bacterium]MCI9084864.1 LrgB family protein [Clostridia bacterium]